MQFFQKLFTSFVLLCITVYAQAQTVTVAQLPGVGPHYTLFNDGVSFGGIVLDSDSATSIGGLVYSIRSCSSNWNNLAQPPFTDFNLVRSMQSVTTGTMMYSREHGWQVIFPLRREVANGNSLLVVARTAEFASAWQANQKCFYLTLEPSGVLTKSGVTVSSEVSFPLTSPKRTLVSARPVITMSRIGAENNRIRTTNDAVFRITISMQGQDFLLLDNLRPVINGSAPIGGFYEVFDEFSGGIITGRSLFFSGNSILWQDGNQPLWGTLFIDKTTTRSFVVRVNSSVFNNAPGPDSLTISLDMQCALEWNLIGSTTAGECLSSLGLDLNQPPLTINYE